MYRFKTLFNSLAIFGIAVVLHGLVYVSGAIPFVDFRLLDIASRWVYAEPSKPFSSTVIVEIDEESLAKVGQWPWPRVIIAQVVQEILKSHPSSLGIDILFPEHDRTSPIHMQQFYKQMFGVSFDISGFPRALSDHDALFADVLSMGKSILPVFASNEVTSNLCVFNAPLANTLALSLVETKYLLCNLPLLQQSSSSVGFINAMVDADGVFRRQLLALTYEGKILPSLALSMIQKLDESTKIVSSSKYFGGVDISFLDKKITTDSNAEVLNYLYPKESFQHVSAVDILLGNVDPSLFTGKFVLLGATATGLFDQFVTPKGNVLPGVYVHASLLENMLNEGLLYQPNDIKAVSFGLSFVLSLVLVWLVIRKQYLLSWGVFLLACIGVIILTGLCLSQWMYPSLGYFLVPFQFLFFVISLFFAVIHYVERKQFLEDLGEAHSATIDSMTMVAESRDIETGFHIVRTKEYVKMLAEYLYKNTSYRHMLNQHIIDLMYRAAPLHDIGKVGIPDAILQKPSYLSEEEMTIMKEHASIGCTIIQNAINSYNKTNEFLTIAANIANTHHEKWDGSGYPLGLKGQEIPLEGRLMALADVYDALISRRCYKEPMDFESAEAIIEKGSGVHFDPILVQAFVVLREEFREIALHHREENCEFM